MTSTGKTHTVRLRHRFDVSVERLFRAWGDPADLASWSWGNLGTSARADVDFTVGGSFRVETVRPGGETWSFSGTYMAIEPNFRIAHTLVWDAPMGYPPAPEHVEVRFSTEGSGSAVDFVHTGVPDEESAEAHERGWRDTMKSLAAYLERSPAIAANSVDAPAEERRA